MVGIEYYVYVFIDVVLRTFYRNRFDLNQLGRKIPSSAYLISQEILCRSC